MFAKKTLGEADIISGSGIIRETTSFAEGKHHSKNAPLSVDKSAFFVGADDETWTHTVLLPLEPESSASANSATSAYLIVWTFAHLIIITENKEKVKMLLRKKWKVWNFFLICERRSILLTVWVFCSKMLFAQDRKERKKNAFARIFLDWLCFKRSHLFFI